MNFLQWRAGHVPGQTPYSRRSVRLAGPSFNGGPGTCPAKQGDSRGPNDALRPSMEGRARARPNAVARTARTRRNPILQWRAGHVPGQTGWPMRSGSGRSVSFNGGPGTCPAKPDGYAHSCSGNSDPSMEGRARARPNLDQPSEPQPELPPFNGGPGTCPAKPVPEPLDRFSPRFLQWRAGHVPGQTWLATTRWPRCFRTFNGGPGTCPAKPGRPLHRVAQHPPFNGGPGTCPAKQRGHHLGAVADVPSMEGRARARPNFGNNPPFGLHMQPLQWRAGHVPGQTRCGQLMEAIR